MGLHQTNPVGLRPGRSDPLRGSRRVKNLLANFNEFRDRLSTCLFVIAIILSCPLFWLSRLVAARHYLWLEVDSEDKLHDQLKKQWQKEIEEREARQCAEDGCCAPGSSQVHRDWDL